MKKNITVDVEGGRPVSLVMHPLKVRQLPEFLNFLTTEHTEHTEAETQGFSPLQKIIDIIQGAVDRDISDLPAGILETLLNIFIDLNFPPAERRNPRKGRKTRNSNDEFPRMLDFLISQGHVYSEIMEYTVPQFRAFIEAAADRLTGTNTKKVDLLSALQDIGIPVRKG